MKKSEKRFYRFDVQRNYQFETHDDKGNKVSDITENDWRKKVTSEIQDLVGSCITEVFCVFHDCDINDDGTSKGLHVHFVVTFKDAKTQTSAIKILGASSVHNCQPCDSYVDSLRYLIHVSESALNDMKYIYNVSDVFGWRIADDGLIISTTVTDFKQGMSRKNDKKTRQQQKKIKDTCAISVMTGDAIVSEVRNVYLEDPHCVGLSAVDYLQDKTLYDRASAEWLQMTTEFYQSHACPLTSIYISGGGGTGKTSLANALAEKFADFHGIHKVASPGKSTTFDFAGNYKGERVSIFNEFSSAFPVEQFLSIFDPLNAMPVNSRHSDKLYFANFAIFTTSVPLETFIYNLFLPYAKENSKIPFKIRDGLIHSSSTTEVDWLYTYIKYLPKGDDKILQIRRRLPIQVCISNKRIDIYVLYKLTNSSGCFAFASPDKGQEPYIRFKTLPYDVNDFANIDKQTSVVVDCICDAINYYYKLNDYKHPNSFDKPSFTIKK